MDNVHTLRRLDVVAVNAGVNRRIAEFANVNIWVLKHLPIGNPLLFWNDRDLGQRIWWHHKIRNLVVPLVHFFLNVGAIHL